MGKYVVGLENCLPAKIVDDKHQHFFLFFLRAVSHMHFMYGRRSDIWWFGLNSLGRYRPEPISQSQPVYFGVNRRVAPNNVAYDGYNGPPKN